MHKVMSRTPRHTPTRPGPSRPAATSRRDRSTASPGAAGAVPPRVPADGARLAPSPGAGRPGGAGRGRPADNRPSGRAAGRGRPGVPPSSATAPREGRGGAVGTVPVRVPQPRPTDRFADLLVAVLSGQRPVHAMLRHSAGQAYDELIRLAERGPLRTRGVRPVVRDIGWFEPREGAIEAFARIGAGDRLRAMAFRLERGRDLRWRCTAVELGVPH
ncbi:Rv3235 family protein [Streptomyces sp. T12]|uniref:Rv3235 family protein n=1 Tax=Streptomyces sp. NPDC093594 TaxID=3155305 RepID=UPI0011A7E2E5|nr:Rv3235 family protein [Streptomyces sp. T12]